MKFLVNWLCIYALAFAPLAQAQTTETMVTDTDSNGIKTVEHLLKNSNAEVSLKDVTASGGTLQRTTGAAGRSGYGFSWDSSAAGQTLTFSGRNIPEALKGNDGGGGFYIKAASGSPTHKIQIVQSGTVLNERTITASTTKWTGIANYQTFVFPTSGAVDIRIISVAADEPTIYLDDGELGPQSVLSQVSQASLFGTAIQDGAAGATCVFPESTSTGTTDFITLGTGTGCNAWVTSGNVGVTGTNSSSITIAQMPAGKYEFEVTGGFQTDTAARFCLFRIYDGSSALSDVSTINNSLAFETHLPKVTGFYDVATPLTSKTFSIQAADDGAGVCRLYNGTAGTRVTWKVKYWPSIDQLATKSNQRTLPKITVYNAGASGTHVVEPNASYVRVRMVGPGGGGGGSSDATGDGGAGGTPSSDTTFSTLTAGKGSGGPGSASGTASGGAGGSATIGAGWTTVLSQSGGRGGGSSDNNITAVFFRPRGGIGGATCFGGGTQASGAGATTTIANSGIGGSGAGVAAAGNARVGGGGGGGACIEAIFENAGGQSFAYSVGSGGTAGTAGTAGIAGDAGAGGRIIVEEFFGRENAPIHIGSVTTNLAGSMRHEIAYFTNAGSCSVSYESGDWLGTPTDPGTGNCGVVINSGMFSAAPVCHCTAVTANGYRCSVSSVSATGLTTHILNNASAAEDTAFMLTCDGPK